MAKALSQITLDFGMPEPTASTDQTPVQSDENVVHDTADAEDERPVDVNDVAVDETAEAEDQVFSQETPEPLMPAEVPVPADYQVEFAIEEGKAALDSISVTNQISGPAVFFEADEEVAIPLEPPAVDEPMPSDAPDAPANPDRKQRELPAPRPYSGRGRRPLRELSGPADVPEVPEDEILFSKQYYSMKDLAAMFRENQSLIRYWETEFDILQPKKNAKGDRFFRPVDVKNLYLIYDLLRRRKFTIEGAKEYLKGNKKAEERFEMIRSLSRIRQFLLELKAGL